MLAGKRTASVGTDRLLYQSAFLRRGWSQELSYRYGQVFALGRLLSPFWILYHYGSSRDFPVLNPGCGIKIVAATGIVTTY